MSQSVRDSTAYTTNLACHSSPKFHMPLASQWLGDPPPPSPPAQLITVKLVVYAMATKPKMQSRMSDHLRSAVFATAL